MSLCSCHSRQDKYFLFCSVCFNTAQQPKRQRLTVKERKRTSDLFRDSLLLIKLKRVWKQSLRVYYKNKCYNSVKKNLLLGAINKLKKHMEKKIIPTRCGSGKMTASISSI